MSAEGTWADLCVGHPTREPMSDAEVAWALRNSTGNAVGWARHVERGGELVTAGRCDACGRGATVTLSKYDRRAEDRAWVMVAKHVETAARCATESAARRLSVSP